MMAPGGRVPCRTSSLITPAYNTSPATRWTVLLISAFTIQSKSSHAYQMTTTRLSAAPIKMTTSPISTNLRIEAAPFFEGSSRRGFLAKSAAVPIFSILASAGVLTRNPEDATAAGVNNRLGGLPSKIRNVCVLMDELQRDLMQERWDLVENYPIQLRSMVPIFTTYTDAAFPTDEPTDKALRVALRYEVGRLFGSVERLRQATSRKAIDEAYISYAEMALHFDRYLHLGDLYTYYDKVISTEPLYEGINEGSLVYADPIKDPAEVRDLIVLVKGPEKGKTGIVIGIYPDETNTCVVKLDKYKKNTVMREIKVVKRSWVGKRLGAQDPDDVFLLPRKGEKQWPKTETRPS